MGVHSFVTFQVEGLHCWPEAPETVSYLRDPHRHTFHFRVEFPQPTDRGIEFFMFADECKGHAANIAESFINDPGVFDYGDLSCERIADIMCHRLLRTRDDLPWVKVTVSEDGQHGSIVMVDGNNWFNIGGSQ